MEKIIIFAYSDATVHIYPYDGNEDLESFIEAKGFRVKDCDYMIVPEAIIHFH